MMFIRNNLIDCEAFRSEVLQMDFSVMMERIKILQKELTEEINAQLEAVKCTDAQCYMDVPKTKVVGLKEKTTYLKKIKALSLSEEIEKKGCMVGFQFVA